jgi:hypothetical protein
MMPQSTDAKSTTIDTLFLALMEAKEAHMTAPWDLTLLGAHQAALGAYINELTRITGETRNAIMHGPTCPCVNCT